MVGASRGCKGVDCSEVTPGLTHQDLREWQRVVAFKVVLKHGPLGTLNVHLQQPIPATGGKQASGKGNGVRQDSVHRLNVVKVEDGPRTGRGYLRCPESNISGLCL